MEYPSPNKFFDNIKRYFKKVPKESRTDEILCACYLCRFRKYKDKRSYDLFKTYFKSLDSHKKELVLLYCAKYEKYQKKIQKEKNKTKTK